MAPRGRRYSARTVDSGRQLEFFPAFLRLGGKPVLLVGGGNVAARKARMLLDAGARLTIVAPETVPAVDDVVASGRARHVARGFRDADVDGHWLVVSACNRSAVGRRVAAAAGAARIFCNVVDDSENCSYITPAVVDRSPLIVAVSSGGAAPVLARRIRNRIETLLPARLGELARLARRWRTRVTVAVTDFGARRRFWESVFAGHVAEAVYAGRDDAAEHALAALLRETAATTSQPGTAWLVGAGPGDPELLTLKALAVMQRADVILHDRLVSPGVLALARRDAELVSVGKAPGCRSHSQAEINALLIRLVAAGKRVCRLKGGDPFIFGRGGEEAEALALAGLPVYVVPGITAAAGCAAAAGIPLTHRDAAQSLVLLTGHGKRSVDSLDWASLARTSQTLAVYMGVSRVRELVHKLTQHGRSADTPVAIIERGTTPGQRVVRGTLGQLALLARAHRIEPPAMLIIGEVARLGAVAAQPATRDTRAVTGFSAHESAVHSAGA